MSFEEVLEKLDTILDILVSGQFKPMTESPLRSPETLEPIATSQPLVQPMQSLRQALASEGVDTSLLEILHDESTVKPVRFLGDLWAKPNDILKIMGYNWVTDGENSRWVKGEQPQSLTKPPQGVTAITDLSENMKGVTIQGTVVDIFGTKEFNRRDGTIGRVASFILQDETGEVRVSLWDDMTNEIDRFEVGNPVRLESLMVRKPYKGVSQVSAGKYTKLRKLN